MPKGSEELTKARKEEIIDACASLYETKSFRDITIRDIGEKPRLPAPPFTTIITARRRSSWPCSGGNTRHGQRI